MTKSQRSPSTTETQSQLQGDFKDGEHQFRGLVERYATLLGEVGVRCVPFDDNNLPLYKKTRPEVQQNAVIFLQNALAVYEQIRMAGESFRNNKNLIWRTLNRLKLIPDSAIFDKISDDDVVEIYALPDHSHLAWNIRLLEQVSFTAEQLLCLPWWEIGSRPPEIMAKLQSVGAALSAGEQVTTVVSPVPKHLVQELGSRELLTIELEIKYISPLRQSGRNAAFMVINGSRIVGSQIQ